MDARIQEAIGLLERGDWAGAHGVVQALESTEAAWLHGVLHMLEGDESNARYWYRRAARVYPGLGKIKDELRVIKQQCAGTAPA